MLDAVSVAVAAGIAGRSPQTIRKWIREGRIGSSRKLGRILLERAEIERVLALPNLPLPVRKKRR